MEVSVVGSTGAPVATISPGKPLDPTICVVIDHVDGAAGSTSWERLEIPTALGRLGQRAALESAVRGFAKEHPCHVDAGGRRVRARIGERTTRGNC